MMRLIWRFVLPYRGRVAVILLAMLAETAMSLAGPWPLKVVLDNAIGDQPAPTWLAWLLGPSNASNRMALAAVAALGIVLLAVISTVANFVDNYMSESVGQWVGKDLRMRVFHHLDRFALSYFDRTQSSTLLSTITDDITTIQNFVAYSMLNILVDVLTIAGMLVLMFWLNFDFALIAVCMAPFFLMFVFAFMWAVEAATREVRMKQSDIVAVVQQGLQLMRVVMAYGRQDLEEAQLDKASRDTLRAALKARKVRAILWPTVGMVVSICTAIVVWRGASLILSGAMTIGELTVFIAYLNRFFSPLLALANISNNIAQAEVAAERVRAILDIEMSMPERDGARPNGPRSGEIVFESVAFGYEPDAPILKNISFCIKPGQLIGVCGPTGCGKSTLASLIPRFYDPSAGRITIDGVDIRDYPLASLRNQIGFVLQDTVLFRGTVRENIAFGRADATEQEIKEAAKLADADEFIVKMPYGYDTQVGERGLTLSGGQRQRIGIARAIVRNPTILILDEPTAALDTEAEKIVMKALDKAMTGRTVITIAHRLSTIRGSDKIIVLKDGVVAEQGTHEELLALDNVYASLHRVQLE